MGTGDPKTFAREATGLVRELGFIDQFVISQAGANWLPGVPLVALFAPFFFPGAYLPLTILIGTIPALGMAVVYSKMSGIMPRSGGDYVWSSRILGSAYGTIQFVFVFAVFIVTALGLAFVFFPTIGVSQLLFLIGAVQNNPGLITAATNAGTASLGFPLSIGLVLLACLVPLAGLRVYAWVQRVSYLIIYIGVVVMGIALLTFNFSGLPAAFNHAMVVSGYNATYSGIIQSAPPSALKFNLTNTILAALPWGFLSFTGFNFGTYLAGETKNAKSNFPKALYLSVAVTALLLTAFLGLVVRDLGSTFLNGASYVVANGTIALPTLPTVTMMLGLINLPVGVFVAFAIILGLIIVTFANTLQLSRLIFAGSFDRLLPDVFSRVSSRYRVPYVAIILAGLSSAIYMTIYWKFGFASVYLNSSLVEPIAFILPLVAVLLWPFVKPNDFKRLTSGFGSYALIAVSAVVAIIGFIIYIIAEMVPILSGVFLGSSLTYAYGTVIGLLVAGGVIYGSAILRARRANVAFNRIFNEIPPE